MIEKIPFDCSVLLSVQRALVGEIFPEIWAISVEWSSKKIQLFVYTEGSISSELKEDFDAGAITQIVADFPYVESGDPIVEFEFIECENGQHVTIHGQLVFEKKDVFCNERVNFAKTYKENI